MPAVTIFAPAKVNLALEALGRRVDGYHEVRSVLQAVSFGDYLTFNPSNGTTFECDTPGWCAAQSLVSRAAALIRAESGCQKGVVIRITKSIPLASGLGGDASDAAAVLRGLVALWGLTVAPERLTELAAGLGSDVPFFLRGGAALAQGRGEIISPLPALTGYWLVIMTPPVPRPAAKTAAVYARLGPGNFTDGSCTATLAACLAKGARVADEQLCNVFDDVADEVFPGLTTYRQIMREAGAARVHLAGAGPSLFGLFASRAEAEEVYGRLTGQSVFLAETLGPVVNE